MSNIIIWRKKTIPITIPYPVFCYLKQFYDIFDQWRFYSFLFQKITNYSFLLDDDEEEKSDYELHDNDAVVNESIQREKIEISTDEDEPMQAPPSSSSNANAFDSLKSDDSSPPAKKKPAPKKGSTKPQTQKRPRKKGSSDESGDDLKAKKKV